MRSALHVHLSHDLCLEVVVMRGQSDQLQSIADRILAMRGVKQGGIEIIAGLGPAKHEHAHEHDHPHEHAAPARASRRRRPTRARRA